MLPESHKQINSYQQNPHFDILSLDIFPLESKKRFAPFGTLRSSFFQMPSNPCRPRKTHRLVMSRPLGVPSFCVDFWSWSVFAVDVEKLPLDMGRKPTFQQGVLYLTFSTTITLTYFLQARGDEDVFNFHPGLLVSTLEKMGNNTQFATFFFVLTVITNQCAGFQLKRSLLKLARNKLDRDALRFADLKRIDFKKLWISSRTRVSQGVLQKKSPACSTCHGCLEKELKQNDT